MVPSAKGGRRGGAGGRRGGASIGFPSASISESSLHESFDKSLRWVLLSVPVWMASVSSGSFRLSPLLSYQVHRSKGLEAVGRFPAARKLRRVGSGALGFLRLKFAMMIIKD